MRKLWRSFCKLRRPTQSLDGFEIATQRAKHMAPFFGHPGLVGVAALASGLALTIVQASTLTEIYGAVTNYLHRPLLALHAANAALLFAYCAQLIQRSMVYSYEKIMALDLGWMLSRRDFRSTLYAQPGATQLRAQLQQHGINATWDDPGYARKYRRTEQGLSGEPCEEPIQVLHRALRDFIGYMDRDRRRHVPGRYQQHLKGAKGSVTAYTKEMANILERVRNNEASQDDYRTLFENLCANYLTPDTEGARVAQAYLNGLARGSFLNPNETEARVWRRDPWVDLTHQEEFFSSASLRGVKLFGRGSKGRLGCFGYVRNPAFSALDFSTTAGRLVRARMIATLGFNSKQEQFSVLLIDGVEGSNAIKPAIVQQGIEDYARACGFDMVLYNRNVHNAIPKRFVDYIASTKAPVCMLHVKCFSDSSREYLDCFGLPLEPFEYAYPRGKVVGHAVMLNEHHGVHLDPPSRLAAWTLASRKNALWLLLAQSVPYALGLTAATLPQVLPAFLAVVAGGLILNRKIQRRSIVKS